MSKWWEMTVRFTAKDIKSAELLMERACDVICGGGIGMGLHVCQNSFVGTLREIPEDEDV